MSQLLRPMYHGIVKYVPYGIKHRFNITRIRSGQLLRKWYNHILPPLHPLRNQIPTQIGWWYQINIKRKEPILIYQMGKVGSRTIEASLLQQNLLSIHIHSLDIDWMLPYFPLAVQNIFKKRYGPNWHWLRRNVIKPGKKVKIVILTRDPVAINISSFFQLLDPIFDLARAHDFYSIDELLTKYDEQQALTYEFMFQWFDQELKRHFGIDIFQYAFDKTNGFCQISQAPYDVLILKLELSDREKSRIIADFLGIYEFEIVSRNVGNEKAYAEVYQQFKRQVRLDRDTLDKAYHSPLATHFYTPEEIAKFRAKWEHKPVASRQDSSDLPQFFVSTYPRSGTTWFLMILADILVQLNGYETVVDTPMVVDVLHWFDRTGEKPDQLTTTVRPIKSHNIDDIEQKNVIYLFRQPADVLTSYYHYHFRSDNLRSKVEELSIDEFTLKYADEWCQHLEKAIRLEPSSNMIFISYEQMMENPLPVLKQVVDFMGLNVPNPIIERAIENRTFEKLKAWEQGVNAVEDTSTAKGYTPFFRKGKVDSGRDELSQQTYEALQQETMPTYKRAVALTTY